MMQSGEYAIYETTGPLLLGFSSLPKIVDDKFKNLLKYKEKICDTIKTVDNSIKSIKGIKRILGHE